MMKYVFLSLVLIASLSACKDSSQNETPTALASPIATRASIIPISEVFVEPTKVKEGSCRNLTELETQVLKAPLTMNQKRSALDVLLVTLRGAQCERLVKNLKDLLKTEALTDFISIRVMQFNNLSIPALFQILEENSEIVFDAQDLWPLAKEVTLRQATQFGKISYDGDEYRVTSSESVKGQPLRFAKTEFKPLEGTTTSYATKVMLETLKAAPKTSQSNIKKLAYDSHDEGTLKACGADNYVSSMKSHSKGGFEEVIISKLTQPENDAYSTKALCPDIQENKEQGIFSCAINRISNQKIEGQSFWTFSKDQSKALQYFTFTRQKAEDFNGSSDYQTLRYTLLVSFHNLKDGQVNVSNQGGALSYKVSPDAGFFKRYSIQLDAPSAWWMKVSVERLAQCMEKSGIGEVGSSRDSIRAYLFAKLFSKTEAINLKKLN